MANFKIYINKIESYKTDSVTGFRLKQTMYNALRTCYQSGVVFPYRYLLEKYCIPSSKDYISDADYYMIADNEIIRTKRTKSATEHFLTDLAKTTGGKVVFSKDKEPMLLINGMLLRASAANSKYFTEEYVENFDTPYDLYPRVINIVGDNFLVETKKGVCEWEYHE